MCMHCLKVDVTTACQRVDIAELDAEIRRLLHGRTGRASNVTAVPCQGAREKQTVARSLEMSIEDRRQLIADLNAAAKNRVSDNVLQSAPASEELLSLSEALINSMTVTTQERAH